MTFEAFGLAEPILRAVRAEGYTNPTPIQSQAIPHVIQRRDVLGCAQTGTGKTAAFALPMLHTLGLAPRDGRRQGAPIRALILAPTRELAAQIGDCFRAYGRHLSLRHAVIFGGVNQNPQTRALHDGVDILVATPGRLLDLMQQGFVDLRHVEILVLDEADRMLDMGFIRDIRKIVAKVPAKRQTLLFSATMPADIRALADDILRDPVYVQVAAVSTPVEAIGQSVYFVEKFDKPAMLEAFFNNNAIGRALVFTRTKHGADRVAKHLSRAGIQAEAIHGNKSQNARTRAISRFKSSAPPVLVATDIAARGLDIDEVSHVVNYDLPEVPETYVHRIGRTGRAGASGLAVSFCDSQERPLLRDIERLIRRPIPVVAGGPRPSSTAGRRKAAPEQAARPRQAETTSERTRITDRRQPARQAARDAARPTVRAGGRAETRTVAQPAAQPLHAEPVALEEAPPRPQGVGFRLRGRSRRR